MSLSPVRKAAVPPVSYILLSSSQTLLSSLTITLLLSYYILFSAFHYKFKDHKVTGINHYVKKEAAKKHKLIEVFFLFK